ncbi:hypothetical protein [[Limnothrix rosea] IAM M-220]|nr:hypothetical protein [[Limnothrix rosea] IAM M-220]
MRLCWSLEPNACAYFNEGMAQDCGQGKIFLGKGGDRLNFI